MASFALLLYLVALVPEPPLRRDRARGRAPPSGPPARAHRREVRRLQPEQAFQIEGVLRGEVLVVVVERHRDPAGAAVETPGAPGQLRELLRAVAVVVLLGHRQLAAGLLVEPAVEVPAVEAQDGPLGRRRRLH